MISVGNTKSWRKKAMMLLIAINLLLLFSFIWQAYLSSHNHLRVTQNVLQDYAKMAGQRFASQVKSNIGYWALHDLRSQLIQSQTNNQDSIDDYLAKADAELKAQQIKVRNGIVSIYHYDVNNQAIKPLFANIKKNTNFEILKSIDFSQIDAFKVVHPDPEQGLSTWAILSKNGVEYFIVEFSIEMIQQSLHFTFQSSSLLPQVLADKLVNNDKINISLQVKDHKPIFQQGQYFNPYLSSTISVNEDYGGLFKNYQITVAIDENMADKLIIGGVPSSQFYKLLLLIILTLFVLIVTLVTYRKEQKLIRQRSQFVARVSHELRTPLTQIRMFSETLLLNRVKGDAEKDKYLAIIHRESKHLSYLVDNILNLHENENKANLVHFESINVLDEMHFILDNFDYVVKERDIQFEVLIDSKQQLTTDRHKFRQVFLNLIDNAIKYGPDGQTIGLKAKISDKAKDKYLKISVRDQGPGICKKEQKHIWQSYYRLNRDDKRAVNGTGIGLAITAENLRSIGAFCQIKNRTSSGACFEVSFPINAKIS